jgi:Type II secretion system (T2SS), protein E, N-terminal domain
LLIACSVSAKKDRLPGGSEAAGSPREVQHESGQSAGPARQPLATLLAEAGVASEEQLRLAVAEGMGRGERLGELVLRRGWIDQPGLARLLARQWELAYVDDEVAVPDPSAGALLSAQESERLAVCVIGFVDGVPLVAVAEPAEERFARVRSTLGRECVFAVVTKSTLNTRAATWSMSSRRASTRSCRCRAGAASTSSREPVQRIERVNRRRAFVGSGSVIPAARPRPFPSHQLHDLQYAVGMEMSMELAGRSRVCSADRRWPNQARRVQE